jgi:Putative polyhydroxyalkanoic acid system protein (PHA_gran_rgn)
VTRAATQRVPAPRTAGGGDAALADPVLPPLRRSGVLLYAPLPDSKEPPMSQPLIVSIPHRLGRQEAKRRLDTGISRLRPELGGLVSSLDYSWDEDRLNFRATAMWQTITGAIEVLDDAVRIEIELPWMMRLLADTVAKQVRGRGVAMLEKPPGET